MTANPDTLSVKKVPTIADAAIFRTKSFLLQLHRAASDLRSRDIVRHARSSALVEQPVIATSRTALWTETDPAERFLVAGKIQNLRIAIRNLDGLEIPAGGTFSFWKQIGRAGRLRGFVEGRELREGCIIPNVGGGLCQLSNALYDAALQAGCEILERHPHTQVIPGSLAESGRDATVFWNYIDLRFRSEQAFRIEARLDSRDLVVRFRARGRVEKKSYKISRTSLHSDTPNSCATCETGDCHRVVKKESDVDFGRTAYLLDEFAPEFDKYVSERKTGRDLLLIPLDGTRFRKRNYAWTTSGFGKVRQSVFVTARRSYRSRKLATQGAARQMNLLRMYEELAESYAKQLSHDVLHVVVHQNLVPFLWRNGHLGGRTFDVLLTSLPMHEIHERLDRAHALNFESRTLGDFRARPELAEAEREALKSARKIITPHTEIASLFPRRAELLEWEKPAKLMCDRKKNDKPVVVFPASTVGRKGCYELRTVLRDMDVRLLLLGPIIEQEDFWDGFEIERGPADWLERASVVVLPAYIEHRPRRLLQAAANGIPVIASTACGVTGVSGCQTVEPGDIDGLRDAINSALNRSRSEFPPLQESI